MIEQADAFNLKDTQTWYPRLTKDTRKILSIDSRPGGVMICYKTAEKEFTTVEVSFRKWMRDTMASLERESEGD